MLIGNSYADNKIYRGIEHYNNRPLTARDLHEQSDTDAMKNAFLMNNLLGRAGTLNTPRLTFSEGNKKLLFNSPLVVMIEGDIVLIQSTSSVISVSSSVTSQYAFLAGWYQKIDNTTTLRAYGGVDNIVIDNDIVDTDIDVLVSTRYQFRWRIVQYSSLTDTLSIDLPDKDGYNSTSVDAHSSEIISDNGARIYNLVDHSKKSYIKDNKIYLVPIFKFDYNTTSGFSNISLVKPLKPMGMLEELDEYQQTIIISNTNTKTYYINIGSYTQKDALQVLYNGVVLTKEVHYRLDNTSKAITLLDFITEIDDEITFIVTKLAESE